MVLWEMCEFQGLTGVFHMSSNSRHIPETRELRPETEDPVPRFVAQNCRLKTQTRDSGQKRDATVTQTRHPRLRARSPDARPGP